VTARGAETRFTAVPAAGVVEVVEVEMVVVVVVVVVVVGEAVVTAGDEVLIDRVGAAAAIGVDGAEGGGEAEALSSAS
jgi:hypothetical protein